jgi:hypothetical protein
MDQKAIQPMRAGHIESAAEIKQQGPQLPE